MWSMTRSSKPTQLGCLAEGGQLRTEHPAHLDELFRFPGHGIHACSRCPDQPRAASG
ncbi:MAG: hypothetical protein M3460_03915 [Actinomycetota bacterium]|nr:hypothetical protein [Actinomycetota bacterium]